jgi:hypothetical protein
MVCLSKQNKLLFQINEQVKMVYDLQYKFCELNTIITLNRN